MEELDVDGMLFKYILKARDWKRWSGFIWLKIGSGGGIL
jgi:hypothetical protein